MALNPLRPMAFLQHPCNTHPPRRHLLKRPYASLRRGLGATFPAQGRVGVVPDPEKAGTTIDFLFRYFSDLPALDVPRLPVQKGAPPQGYPGAEQLSGGGSPTTTGTLLPTCLTNPRLVLFLRWQNPLAAT